MKNIQLYSISIGLVMLCLLPTALTAQEYKISGTIKDRETKEVLIGATLSVLDMPGKGAVSDEHGTFSLQLPKGDYFLLVKYIGYQSYEQTVSLQKDIDLDLLLLPSEVTLSEVVVNGLSNREKVLSTQSSVERLDTKTSKFLPVLFGEPDIIKTLQLKPGVSSAGEGTSGISVRGGGTDQNLFLYDGTPVYNPNHLFGFFSTFNSDAIKDIVLYKAGFPAEYSGRLSSVLEVNSQEADDTKSLHASGGIGLISSRLNIRGKIPKTRLRYNLSARRTYVDLATEAVNRANSDNPDFSQLPRYYFYDFNGRLDYAINERNDLMVSAYYGRDFFNLPSSDFKSIFDWGNTAIALKWDKRSKNNRWSSATSLHYAAYDYQLNSIFDRFSFDVGSGIQDIIFKQKFIFSPSSRHIFKFGTELTDTRFSISRINITDQVDDNDIVSGESPRTFEGGLYATHEWELSQRWKTDAGVRMSTFLNNDQSYIGVEPRFNVRHSISDNLSVKASYARMIQYWHLVASSGASLPTDIWYPTTAKVKPEYSDQVAAALSINLNDKFLISNEVYYKRMQQLVDYKLGANLFVNGDLESEFVFGTGNAYGNEVYIEKTSGKLRGWVGYTLSWTNRKFPDINEGRIFYPRFDRRHDLSMVLIYTLNPRVTFSATWVYYSGNPVSLAEGRYVLGDNPYVNETENRVKIAPDFPSRNNYRLPNYHRLDLGLVYQLKSGLNFSHDLTFGVYNTYNRPNPYLVRYETVNDAEGIPGNFKARNVSLFPVIPSITYNFKF